MIQLVTVINKELFIPLILGWVSAFLHTVFKEFMLTKISLQKHSLAVTKQTRGLLQGGEGSTRGGESQLRRAVLGSCKTGEHQGRLFHPCTSCHFILCPTCSKISAFRNSFLLPSFP